MRARSLALVAPLLLAAIAGCGGGTRACKEGTLFVTVMFGGSTSAADAVTVDVTVDGTTKTTARDRTTNADGTFEINFPNNPGYPTGKRVDVRITALENGTVLGSKTGSISSLPAGCATLAIALDGTTGTGGTGGAGGAGGTGGGAAGTGGGAAGTGGSTGGRGGTAGRGGTGGSAGSIGGTGGATAGRGGTGGAAGTGGSTAGTSGTAGRGGTGGSTGGTGGGTAGRGGSGGVGGSSGGRGGGGGGPVICPLASFDSNTNGVTLNTYNNGGNIAVREAGPVATLSWSATEGDPAPGALKIDAPFSDYTQYIAVTRNLGATGLQDWRGATLHVRLKFVSNPNPGANPTGITAYVQSYNLGANGKVEYHYKGGTWTNVTSNGWTDYVVDLAPEGDFDPSKIIEFGVNVNTGDGTSGTGTNPVKPIAATIYVDSFLLEGVCPTILPACLPNPPATALITNFSDATPGSGGNLLIYGSGPASGGSFVYGTPPPTLMLNGGALHATWSAPAAAAGTYAGFGLSFNECVDARAYTGVRFTLTGTVTGCTMQYSSNYSENSAMAVDPKGMCTVDPCVPSQVTITPQSGPRAVPWTAATGGTPQPVVDSGKLVGLLWQFTVPASTACSADVTLDDVTFY